MNLSTYLAQQHPDSSMYRVRNPASVERFNHRDKQKGILICHVSPTVEVRLVTAPHLRVAHRVQTPYLAPRLPPDVRYSRGTFFKQSKLIQLLHLPTV